MLITTLEMRPHEHISHFVFWGKSIKRNVRIEIITFHSHKPIKYVRYVLP